MFQHLYRKTIRFLSDESGPTAVEYAVMLAAIVIAVLASVQLVAEGTAGSFNDSSHQIEQAMN